MNPSPSYYKAFSFGKAKKKSRRTCSQVISGEMPGDVGTWLSPTPGAGPLRLSWPALSLWLQTETKHQPELMRAKREEE